MNKIKASSTLILLLGFVFFAFAKVRVKISVIDKKITPILLKNTDGNYFQLDTNQKGYIVVFTCNHCPFAKLYTNRYNQLNSKYSALNVPLIAINPMDSLLYEEENFEEMKKNATSNKFNFPYLQDGSQNTALDFGANHTPQAYIIWREKNNWIIKYSGSIDDNGEHPELAKPLIANAVDSLLQNKKISNTETNSFGCAITIRKK